MNKNNLNLTIGDLVNMTLEEAIAHAKEIAASKCDECGKEHQQLAEWLAELVDLRTKMKILGCELSDTHLKYLKAIKIATELLMYEDKRPITKKFLYHNFPLCSNYCHFLDGNDFYLKITRTIDKICFVEVENKINGKDYHHECVIKTIGQLRMFLTICGLGDFVKQLKS